MARKSGKKRRRARSKRRAILQQLETRRLLAGDATSQLQQTTVDEPTPMLGAYLESMLGHGDEQSDPADQRIADLPTFSIDAVVDAPNTGFSASFERGIADLDGLNLDFSDAVDATYSGTSSLNTEDGLQTFTYDVLIDGNVQGGLGTYHERVVIDFLVSEPIAPAGNEIGAVNHDGTLTYEFWATPDAAGGSGFSYRIDLDVVDSITKDVDENWNDGSTETAWENAGHFVGHGSGNDNVFLDITGSTIVGGQPTMFQASGGGQFTFDGTGQYDLKRSWLANQSLSDAMEADAGGEKHELTRSWGTSTGFRSDSWTYGGSGTVMDQPADSWLPTLVGWTRSGDLNHKVTRDGQSSQSRISEAHGRLTAGESAGFRSWFIDSRGSEAFKVNNQRDVDVDAGTEWDGTYTLTSGNDEELGRTLAVHAVGVDHVWSEEEGDLELHIDQNFAGVGEAHDYDLNVDVNDEWDVSENVTLDGVWRVALAQQRAAENDADQEDAATESGSADSESGSAESADDFVPLFVGTREVTGGTVTSLDEGSGNSFLHISGRTSINNIANPTLPGDPSVDGFIPEESPEGESTDQSGGSSTSGGTTSTDGNSSSDGSSSSGDSSTSGGTDFSGEMDDESYSNDSGFEEFDGFGAGPTGEDYSMSQHDYGDESFDDQDVSGDFGSDEPTEEDNAAAEAAANDAADDAVNTATGNNTTDSTTTGDNTTGNTTTSNGTAGSEQNSADDETVGGSDTSTASESARAGGFVFQETSNGFQYRYETTTTILHRLDVWSADREYEGADGSSSKTKVDELDHATQPLDQMYTFDYESPDEKSFDHLSDTTSVTRVYDYESTDNVQSAFGTVVDAFLSNESSSGGNGGADELDIPEGESIEAFFANSGDSEMTYKVDGTHVFELDA